jgi:hypothetical protein
MPDQQHHPRGDRAAQQQAQYDPQQQQSTHSTAHTQPDPSFSSAAQQYNQQGQRGDGGPSMPIDEATAATIRAFPFDPQLFGLSMRQAEDSAGDSCAPLPHESQSSSEPTTNAFDTRSNHVRI